MNHHLWEDQSLMAKLAFSGYTLVYHDRRSGIDESSHFVRPEQVEEMWNLLLEEMFLTSYHIKFPTPTQLGLMWFACLSSFVPYRIVDSNGAILWQPDK